MIPVTMILQQTNFSYNYIRKRIRPTVKTYKTLIAAIHIMLDTKRSK